MNSYVRKSRSLLLAVSLVFLATNSFFEISLCATTDNQKINAAHVNNEDSFRNQISYYTDHVRNKVSHHILSQDIMLGELSDRLKSAQQLLLIEDIADYLSTTVQMVDEVKCNVEDKVLEELRCALLIQLIVPLDIHMRKLIFLLLDKVDKAIVYWQEQQQYPLHYFFHKSPFKITSGQPQQREIEEKLIFLRGVQKSMFEFLGKWMIQINQFNRTAQPKEHYEWLVRLLAIPSLLIHGEPLQVDQLNNYDKIVPLVRDVVTKIPRYMHKVDVLVSTAYIPNHFERNWLGYTIAGIGLGVAGLYAQRYKKEIPLIFNNFRNTLYTSFIQTPRDAMCDAFPFLKPFIGKGMPDPVDIKKDDAPPAPSLGDKAGRVSEAFKDVLKNFQGNKGNISRETLVKDYKTTVREFLNARDSQNGRNLNHKHIVNNEEITDEVLNRYAENLDRGFISSCTNECFSQDLPNAKGGLKEAFGYTKQINYLVHGISLINITMQILNLAGENAKKDIDEALYPAIDQFLRSTGEESDNLLRQVRNILKQNQVTFAITACVPIGAVLLATGLVTKKLYRWWMHKDHLVIQRTLISIAHLLNLYEDVHPNQMRVDHYGELLYHGHKLKKEKRKIPQSLRHQFVQDIERLEGNMRAQKKLYVIDLMYKSYPFLYAD